MAGWLTAPVQLDGSRMFDCEMFGFTDEQCAYYQHRWHFWYIADYVYALPTIAFFMCTIGIFILGYWVSSLRQMFGYHRDSSLPVLRQFIATTRYLSYRGFRVRALAWNSAPLGLLLLAAAGTAFFLCMDLIPKPYYWPSLDFGGSPPLGTRSGWMALACMPFVFATASKTNWITLVTGVSYERLQVFHRWISYAFFLLALMHTFPFIVYHIRFHDMVAQVTEESTLFYWTGIVALVFQAWLTFASHSTIRNMNYEFFKATHILAMVVFVLIFFWHCDYTLTSWDYFVATAAVYVPCLVYSWLRTFVEYKSGQKAQVSVEDNDFVRIVVPINTTWAPGSHCFLRFTSFGIANTLSSHPFTICSLPPISPDKPSEMAFYMRRKGGLTAKLHEHALQHPGVSVPVQLDGPYGGIDIQKFNTSDRLLVVAGGSGAGWILPFVELFARQNDCSTVEDKRVAAIEPGQLTVGKRPNRPASLHVVLATRDMATRTWFRYTIRTLLAKYATTSSATVQVEVYLTGDARCEVGCASPSTSKPRKPQEPTTSSSSSAVSSTSSSMKKANSKPARESSETPDVENQHELLGRPVLPQLIRDEAYTAASNQSLGVFVCGPSTMQNDVRNAVAAENLRILKGSKSAGGGVYLYTEHFTWA